MKKEIVENSGLLQKIPPTDYRFPHRTFMEFFGASFIEKQKNAQDMLALYYSDPTKWKEVLLLCLGLNKNKEYACTILKRLADDFRNSIEGETAPDHIIFNIVFFFIFLFWGSFFPSKIISMLRFSILRTWDGSKISWLKDEAGEKGKPGKG